MSANSLVARVTNLWRAMFNPTATAVEYELSRDRSPRHPDGDLPTPLEYGDSRRGAVGLEVRVRKTDRKRADFSRKLQEAKGRADVALKQIIDLARAPFTAEALERAARLREHHRAHAQRLSFRGVRLPKWVRIIVEATVLIADYGVWFTLLMVGMGLSFTKMRSASDPTKVYNPDWFLAHPMEWITAFVVPLLAALLTLAIGKLAGRRWAQYTAMSTHPERADEVRVRISRFELWGVWASALVLLGVALYFVAAMTFTQFADELGWLIGAPWALIPLGIFLVERYGQDPIAELDELVLHTAAEVESRREELEKSLFAAEDAWRAVWTSYDDLLREVIDGANSDLNFFDQTHMWAIAKSENSWPFAPISDSAQPLSGRAIDAATTSAEDRLRAEPVVLEQQRGLRTRVAPWITKQIELDIQLLADCRPAIDSGEARAARVSGYFDTAYAAQKSSDTSEAPVAAKSAATASGPIDLDPKELAAWDRLTEEASRD